MRDVYLSLLRHPDATELAASLGLENLMAALVPVVVAEPTPVIVAWEQSDPGLRYMSDAPADISAKFTSYLIVASVPDHWRGDTSALLCSRTATGWNICISLSAFAPDGPQMLIDGLRVPGETVEVVLIDPATGYGGPTQVIGRIDSAALDAKNNSIEISIDSTGTPTDALNGQAPVELTEGA